jgi:soluble epoxide hydrolase/lipid-phosphate phosphatase
MITFSSLGFRVIAPDARGYGDSTVTENVADYRVEQHVSDMMALLKHLNRDQALWVGHDWVLCLLNSLVLPSYC